MSATKPVLTPLISVVVCTYNGEKYLKTQLDSILNQTYNNVEIIIADDCSTDKTWNVINHYTANFSQIYAYKNDFNLGYIKNFEKAIGMAKSDFVALSDQDDVWELNKLEVMQQNIANFSMVYCDSEMIDSEGLSLNKKMSQLKNLSNINSPAILMVDNCIAGHATLFKKEIYFKALPFPKEVPHDWWLAFVATLNQGIGYIDMPLVKYRQHANNVIGSIKIKTRSKGKVDNNQHELKRTRLKLFYGLVTDTKNKNIIANLMLCYQSFSFTNNIKRVILFINNRDTFLFVKKRNSFRKLFFCFKMFSKIR